jgi:uncharacterized protein YgfB (UPF0149 family)
VNDLGALALEAAAGLSASELHGAVCGLLVADTTGFEIGRLIELVGEDALADQDAVHRFVAGTASDLFAEDLSFEPLLPGDDEPLATRAAGLAQWCGAFVSGFAHAAGEPPDEDANEVAEILRDFVAISELEDAASEGEADERDLVELIEYARVGALLLIGALQRHPEEDTP